MKKFSKTAALLMALVLVCTSMLVGCGNAKVAGTYTGSYEKEAMGVTFTYGMEMVLAEDNTYTYTVTYSMMGVEYSDSETGTYEVDGTTVTFTSGAFVSESEGESIVAEYEDGSITLSRCVSGKASSPVEVTLTAE